MSAEIEFTTKPDVSTSNSAMMIARQRDAIAPILQNQHPGKWAVISKGHATRSAARQVRDRIKSRDCWRGAEWAVLQEADVAGGEEPRHMICARFPDGSVEAPIAPNVQILSEDEISPTF